LGDSLTKYYWGDHFKINELGGERDTCGGEDVHTGFWYGKRPIRRLRRRWEVNTKMDMQERIREGLTRMIWLRIRTRGELL